MSPILTLVAFIQSRTAKRENGVITIEYVLLAVAVAAFIGVVAGPISASLDTKVKSILP